MFFQITAISFLLFFYGCYFAKMLSQRKKGIRTDQIGKGKEDLEKSIEITMKLVTILVPIVESICIFLNETKLPTAVRCLGAVIAVLGSAVFVCSVATMRDSWRAGVSKTDKTDLVTNGIYRFSRNPAFLGFDLVYIGVLLMFFHWGLLALSVAAIVIFHLQIVMVEEPFLRQTFGRDYLNYSNKVRRYLGRSAGGCNED